MEPDHLVSNWPWLLRSTHDRIVAELQHQLQVEKARSRRRAKRHAAETLPVVKSVTAAAAAAEPSAPSLPDAVLEVIEARAGSLHSRAARTMVNAAQKAIESGEPVEKVIDWMWSGDPE